MAQALAVQENNTVDEYITLNLFGQDNVIMRFKVKKNIPLRKLMLAYCERAQLPMQVARFIYEGQAISVIDTAITLEMEEGDTIEVFCQQNGGME